VKDEIKEEKIGKFLLLLVLYTGMGPSHLNTKD